MTIEAYPAEYNVTATSTGALWMKKDTFLNVPDDLMETALISCINYCKRFPTVAEIRQAIKELTYVGETKPKQIAWEVNRTESLHQKIMDMAMGKVSTNEYLQSVDITKLKSYAKIFFPAISDEVVLKNYNEFFDGMKSQDMCFSCRTAKQACGNMMIKHELLPSGYIKNFVDRCEKQDRRA